MNSEAPESMWFENDVFPKLADCKVFFAFHTTNWWSQLKTAAAAIYANRHYLHLYHVTHPERLAKQKGTGPKIIGDVFIHSSAIVSPTAVIGPNVSIGSNVTVAAGVRIRESIILDGAVLQEQCCVLYSVIGWNCHVGEWARVEGTPVGPNPNMPFAKLESKPLFNPNGKLNPSITVIGCNVQIPTGIMVLNSIVLPHKELEVSYMNQIIL
ncbi:unnamed protein product [Soboliphyme baturini]|uniref:NTP_transferase domain-containing protein n=1 Tax=Soboliphyme baturini TaxID=241478 RepID=A0A183IIQ0_9BILA|nr:unnamed protein product [Soboliphyme baturini]